MSDIAAWLGGLTGINAAGTTISGGKLHIQADAGYTFDFLGGAAEDIRRPGRTTRGGFWRKRTARDQGQRHLHGSGQRNLYLHGEDKPAGTDRPGDRQRQHGPGGTNSAGEVVAILNVGEGYEPGTLLSIEEGIRISLDANGSSGGT